MLPYIDVEGLRELPLTLLGRFPDKIPKKYVDKIANTEALFKVLLEQDPHAKHGSCALGIVGLAEEILTSFFLACTRS